MRGRRQVSFPRPPRPGWGWFAATAATLALLALTHPEPAGQIWHATSWVGLGLLFAPAWILRGAGRRRLLRALAAAALAWCCATVVLQVAMMGQSTADIATCSHHLRRLGRAALSYADAHDGLVPAADLDWQAAYATYLDDPDVFRCPCAKRKDSYCLNPALRGKRLSELARPADEVALIYDAQDGEPVGPHNGYCTVLFADGHVQMRRLDRLRLDAGP